MLYDRGIRVQFQGRTDFSVLQSLQSGLGAHTLSYPKGTGSSFLEDVMAGRKTLISI
jgi:hypothetical protein